jgi:hypothetical protein
VRHHEHHAHFVVGDTYDSDRRNELRLLGLDSRCQFFELLSIEWSTCESRYLVLQSWAEPAEVEAGHLRGTDRCAFWRLGLLCVCRHRQDEQREQESKLFHDATRQQEQGRRLTY